MTCVNTARARRLASGAALLTIVVAAPLDGVRAADLFDDFSTLRGTVTAGRVRWDGFQIGIHAGYVSISDFRSTNAPPFVNGDSDQWKFVWAGMAGVGWAVAPNLTLDFGYRYLSLGNLETASSAAGSMTFKNVAGHEVRVGLRWSFDDLREYR